ncbi:hypothetical protein B0H12DRAFT_1233154 [Mycena haematopus]|nr:hypothetical protein B0H12DRAFT_1233154 [Mycena haematopus]
MLHDSHPTFLALLAQSSDPRFRSSVRCTFLPRVRLQASVDADVSQRHAHPRLEPSGPALHAIRALRAQLRFASALTRWARALCAALHDPQVSRPTGLLTTDVLHQLRVRAIRVLRCDMLERHSQCPRTADSQFWEWGTAGSAAHDYAVAGQDEDGRKKSLFLLLCVSFDAVFYVVQVNPRWLDEERSERMRRRVRTAGWVV